MDPATRSFFDQRFAHDFGDVRIHSDEAAAASARALNASAYTVGRDVVMGSDHRGSEAARYRLLAHELAHVVQQRQARIAEGPLEVASVNDPREQEAVIVEGSILAGEHAGPPLVSKRSAMQLISRADPAAVGRVMGRGLVVGSGIQFWPTNVVDTRVGPVSGQGGLMSSARSLSVIIGQGVTIRQLAHELLPLWTTATPFTPPGGGAPAPMAAVTEGELAQALLVFNRFYLPVPAMTQWRAGLRFPLPVEIDEATGMATVHPTLIQSLAGTFDPAWEPLMFQSAAITVAPPAAELNQQVTDFLTARPSVLQRAIGLVTRALTNAVAARPFITGVFSRVGDRFDLAVSFMDSLVNHQLDAIASQADGRAILAEVEAGLALRPAALTQAQQASLDRANLMLGRRAAVVARPAPAGVCAPGRTRQVPVQPVFFRDNAADPAPTGTSFNRRMQVARDVWGKLGVQFAVSAAVTLDDAARKVQGATMPEIQSIAGTRTAAGVEVFLVDNDIAFQGGAFTFFPWDIGAKVVLTDRGTSNSILAHEMGHVMGLFHPGTGTPHDGDADTVMRPTGSHSIENPTRNTQINAARLTWPPGAATCTQPDP